MTRLPFAETVAYWKTGRTAPDAKIDQVVDLVKRAGGKLTERGFMQQGERSAFLVAFELEGESFRIVWPVLPTKAGQRDTYPARIQAATHVYHHVKASLEAAKVLGARVAFAAHLELADRRTVSQHLNLPASADLPRLLFQASEAPIASDK